jgi:16S rRNA (cytidine1402-2'-O)-methyltransferase
MSKSRLYLVPTLLADLDPKTECPPSATAVLQNIRHFVVESEKESRRFLRKLIPGFDIDNSQFNLLNEHSKELDFAAFLAPLKQGLNMALLSDAGCPAVADPGSSVVLAAHQQGFRIVPLSGASSIMMTLMASGLNGQQFSFHGYVPKDAQLRIRHYRGMEETARKTGYTQLFMDTPYRSRQILEEVLEVLHEETLLCVSSSLTSGDEYIRTLSVRTWRKMNLPDLHKKPCMFALGTPGRTRF